MKKKNKRSCFRKVESKYNNRRKELLKYIPKQPKLIKFLMDNEADERYIKALQKEGLKQAFIRVDMYDSICWSFTWSSTKEGTGYWNNLNDEFNKIIKGN